MKKLVFMLLLAGIATVNAQIIQLDEAKVDAKTVKIISTGENLKFVIVEEYSNQFMKNPIGFMKENFNIYPFIDQMKGKNYVSDLVEFRNSKGYLQANFDKRGNLESTVQRFKNVPIPLGVARELVTNHKGWRVTKNRYLASGKGEMLDKELYKITLSKGKKSQNVKIIPDRSVAGLVNN